MKTKDKLGEELKRIREDVLSCNQKELAQKLKISHVYLSYLEQGKKVPSLELLENLYSLIGEKKVPEKIVKLLSFSKNELKNRNASSHIQNNYIYLIDRGSLYDLKSLKKILDKEPENIYVIYSIITLLVRENKKDEAEQTLLDSLKKLTKGEDKKWIQAHYNKLQGDMGLAIQLMTMAYQEFEKNNQDQNEESLKKKAYLLFELACFCYQYANYFFYEEKNIEKSLELFFKALDYHKILRTIDINTMYQMDYASIYFCIALAGFESKKNWYRYIKEAKEGLRLNYYEGINNYPSKRWNSIYMKPYIVSTYSFIARSYAELALLEKDNDKKIEYLNIGEELFIQSTPIEIDKLEYKYYTFYFNQAYFYSIKAQVFKSLNDEMFEKDLDLCYKAILELKMSNCTNSFKLFLEDLNSDSNFIFFKEKRKEQFLELLEKAKNKD